jgi:hypothetical protein
MPNTENNPWRAVLAAWTVALLFFAGYAGFEALAALRPAAAGPAALLGAVVPSHDPRCYDGQCPEGPRPSPFAHFAAGDYTVP